MAAHKKASRKGKPPIKNKKGAETKDICFTIMPFGGWFDDYYETIYCPAIEAAGLIGKRADDIYRPSTIVHDIWQYTQNAKVVLADLSGKNPNVFYELGLAHAATKPAILVTDSIDDVPFDLRALRVLEYNKNQPNWGEELRQKITASIKEIIASPLQSVLPAFLTVKNESKNSTVSEQEKAFLELKSDFDLLRQEIAHVGRQISPRESRVNMREDRINPDEAREKVKLYLKKGMPEEMIVRRLTEVGAPRSWVIRKIDEYTTKKESENTPNSSE
ncbi:hypothetical protein FNB15_19185 [Ferrovibrio terrae]|uniref:Uncharacterized protein n=1 Tax=Ferrovibrio terrae TaxID=2594003 RepID=A0A516H675_9PROT|nr:hypothetical protein [Ferrovibrio terrae]QDO99267.1 hypothetical protein FNB15_19185 [Ferrovibrio terrae]